MPFMPFQILGMWFRGLLSIVILAGAVYCLKHWYDDSRVLVPDPVATSAKVEPAAKAGPGDPVSTRVVVERRVFRYRPAWDRPTAWLAGGLALLAWATLGRWIGHSVSMLTLRSGSNSPPTAKPGRAASKPRSTSKKARRAAKKMEARSAARSKPEPEPESDEDPRSERTGEVHTIRRPDGSELRVECYGPPDGPPIVWTHGWGADSTEWFYQKLHLAKRFRLIVWDEPGLGFSKQPDNKDYRMENLAADLEAVLAFAAGRPAVLVGHSIGGMITLTFCKLFPEMLGPRVAGLVLAHTSYTNPVRTTKYASIYTALEKPVLIPMMHLTIALWPLVMILNWMSYINGSAHKSTKDSSFAGTETRGQLTYVARCIPTARPDVLARGMLGMIRYDATPVLAGIRVPTLVVVGDQDTTTLPEAGQRIARTVPGAELVTLSPAKHMGLIEHHGEFDRQVAQFVDTCQPAGAGRNRI